MPLQDIDLKDNGWGAVLITAGCPVQWLAGAVPPDIVAEAGHNAAYIYFLEAWAQVAALAAFQDQISAFPIFFCDNEAAKHALIKGYSKAPWVNASISAFWHLAARRQLHPWIERVSSKANLADPVSRHQPPDFLSGIKIVWSDQTAFQLLRRAASDTVFAHSEEAIDSWAQLGSMRVSH
jgi:hypothetical protein